jgi:hypothetical protein
MFKCAFRKKKEQKKLSRRWRQKHMKIIYAHMDGDDMIDDPDEIATHIKRNHFHNLGGDFKSNYIQHQQYAYHATLLGISSKCCLCFKQELTIFINSCFSFKLFGI